MSFFTNPIILFVERVYVPTSKDTMRDTFKQCYNFANLQIGAPLLTRDLPIVIFFVVAQCITLLSHLMKKKKGFIIIKEKQTLHPIWYAYTYTLFFFLLPFKNFCSPPPLCGEEIFTPSNMVKDLMNPPRVTPFHCIFFWRFLSILCP